jgi:hypothetical protein
MQMILYLQVKVQLRRCLQLLKARLTPSYHEIICNQFLVKLALIKLRYLIRHLKSSERRGGLIQINLSIQTLSLMKKVDQKGAEEVVLEENSKILRKLKRWSTKVTPNFLVTERKEVLHIISQIQKELTNQLISGFGKT